jgi:signal transduction histidine kinase
MRRATWIFLAAILLPCLVLAWLAIRSEQDQQVILQHQQAIIDQGVADSLAQNVRTQMDAVLAEFVRVTQKLRATAASPEELADGFHHKIREAWPLAQVGFAVNLQGTIYAPVRSDGFPAQTFRQENESFLSNREDAEVYSNVQNELKQIIPAARAVMRNTASSEGIPAGQMSRLKQSPRPPPGSTSTGSTESNMSGGFITDSLQAPQNSSPNAALAGAAKKAVPPSAVNAPTAVTMTAAPKTSIDEDKARATSDLAPAGTSNTKRAPSSHAVASVAALSDKNESADTAAATPDSITSLPAPAASPSDQAQQERQRATSHAVLHHDAVARDIQTQTSAAPVAPTAPTAAPAMPLSRPSLSDQQQIARLERQVAPLENTSAPGATLSNVMPAQSDFRQLIGQSTSGSVARFLEDKLCLLVWSLPAHGSIVFGAQLNQDKLVDRLSALLQPGANRSSLDSSFGSRVDYCLALIDDKGRPVALSQPGFITDWKHPFVATEIGGVLPHWEAALYLLDPHQVLHSARVLHFTIGLIILLLVIAIMAGGTLIGADVGRQMRLAQQKTDFVSNVSHELKTPLTSIRMFADMLADGRVEEREKQATYLRIISAESARLTRLINNVLDFARLERGAPAGEQHACDLVEAARDVVETCQPHLESAGITLGFEIEAESLPLLGDRDALSQIILNLISNAEKYGGGEILVRVRRQETPSGPMGCVDVLDRGPGIPARQVEAVFAPFQRLDDSLSSGIPGSGLGLTLARRMARAHGGDVTYQLRAGGGSCFTLALPLSLKK